MQDENYTETEGMHTDTLDVEEYSIEDSEEIEEINFDTVVDTKISNIEKMFTAAELKRTEMSRHYIVRDSIDEFYYLKVNIFQDRDEFEYCLTYFQDLMTFTQQLAQTKKDVLRILNVRRACNRRSRNSRAKATSKSSSFRTTANPTASTSRKSRNCTLFAS